MEKILDLTKRIIKENVTKDDICVDMTIGNGNDTLTLANYASFVYGFDIQQEAIDNTNKLLKDNNITNYQLFLDSHENIDKYIDKKIKLFIYNLGYLPKGDKKITTKSSSTINSLIKALKMLDNKGIIIIVIYTGHDEGKNEEIAINDYVRNLDQKMYEVVLYKFINQINNPPYVIMIEKK